jgi:hypothetical protein
MSEQVKAKSDGAGMPTNTGGCSQSSATHTVYPLLAGSLIRAEEDPNSLKKEGKNYKMSSVCTHQGYLFRTNTFGASGRAILHPSNALYMNFSSIS